MGTHFLISRRRHRVRAIGAIRTAVACIAALSLVPLGMSAHAAPEIPPGIGNIDATQKGQIHLHKRESGSQGTTEGSVSEKTNSGTPVAGVTFVYYPVTGLDLTTAQGWEELASASAYAHDCDIAAGRIPGQEKTLNGYALGEAKPFPVTNSDGDTSVTGLPIGAYLVCETEAPATVRHRAAPFVVTIPSLTVHKEWVYSVHAYPKNTVFEPALKAVEVDQNKLGIRAGEQVTFTISAKIPSLGRSNGYNGTADEHFAYFAIADSLINEYTEGRIATVTIADDAQGSNATPIEPQYYTTLDYFSQTAESEPGRNKNWLMATFTNEGLNYLQRQNGKYVIVTITAKVASLGANGHLENIGYLISDTNQGELGALPPPEPEPEKRVPEGPWLGVPGEGDPGYFDGSEEPDPHRKPLPEPIEQSYLPPIVPPATPGAPPAPADGTQRGPEDPLPSFITPTNKVVTTWGHAKILKHAADNVQTGLRGAVFEVYLAQVQDQACSSNEISIDSPNPISVNGEKTFTSDAQGVVEVPGLGIGSGIGVGAQEPAVTPEYRCYIFKEIQAPLGYILPRGSNAQKAVKVTPGTSQVLAAQIPNSAIEVPELPLTGASTTVLMAVGGVSLILLALGLASIRQRRLSSERY